MKFLVVIDDVIADKDISMSAFGGKADVNHQTPECPLIAISGHSRSDKTFIGRIEKGFDLPLLSFRPGRAIRG